MQIVPMPDGRSFRPGGKLFRCPDRQNRDGGETHTPPLAECRRAAIRTVLTRQNTGKTVCRVGTIGTIASAGPLGKTT